ncbi:MAG: FAD-dependent oxidoreductase [Myxococcota bacterium]|nr:FAD-dependent oxidoreductase [Myxococcota bacterium]
MKEYHFMTDAQFARECERCEFCEEKPCKTGCPADCSPADFIMAAKYGRPEDFQRAAAEIMTLNPLGGICGVVCPDTHCQARCTHRSFGDGAIEIPQLQAFIVEKAKKLGVMPKLQRAPESGKRVAVVGGGPAGLATAAMLAQLGHSVTIFEKTQQLGGVCRLIPPQRLPPEVLQSDIDWVLSQGGIEVEYGQHIDDPKSLKDRFDAVVVTAGLHTPIKLNIEGASAAIYGNAYLAAPTKLDGRVVVVGGGAIACDCATSALNHGADSVEMICLEKFSEMPLTPNERAHLEAAGVELSGRTRLRRIIEKDGVIQGIDVIRVSLPAGQAFRLDALSDVAGSEQHLADVKHVLIAIGNRPTLPKMAGPGVFFAGDGWAGPSTVVEASASGKNVARQVEQYLKSAQQPDELPIVKPIKSYEVVPGYAMHPVSLECDFFGRKLPSPFLLSAAPPSDGYEQMKRALDAGWAGGIMKTAFDGVPIHIPAGYMFTIDQETYGNCDNVSDHPLQRVCEEIKKLVVEYPDRLIGASTGGPLTGNDEADKRAWQSNMRKLEEAGAQCVEFSLSCPQGGDGTEGDIVSQNAKMTAKIIDWLLETSDPEIPKLFKLTAAVTSIVSIMNAIKEVLARYPNKKAGVTLANTFPSLTFREREEGKWPEGIVVGLSGQGVTPISYLTLASVANMGITVSGNGGPMNHLAAANFLALGCNSVQFCTVAMKEGVGIISHLNAGLSHFLAAKGMKSVAELIGAARPNPMTGFMELSPVKAIPTVDEELCVSCGNCTRCSYFGVTLDAQTKKPVFHPEQCVGCTLCTKKCFTGALHMRPRTPEELAALGH